MAQAGNLLETLPPATGEERFDTLLLSATVRIERIVSHGECSPEGFWYDQKEDEWVVVLSGAARLAFDNGEEVALEPGGYCHLPARCRHRVAWTDPGQPTVWLAFFFPPQTA